MPIVFKGRVFSVEVAQVTLPNEREVTIEVVRHPKSVVLIPVPSPGAVILIRQYRAAVNQWLWELPAGSVDEGEEPEAAARRECHEEIGLVPQALIRLGTFHPRRATATRRWCSSRRRAWKRRQRRPRRTKTKTSR